LEIAMRTGIVGSIGALLAAAPLGLADPPAAGLPLPGFPAAPPPAISADLPGAALPLPGLPAQLPATNGTVQPSPADTPNATSPPATTPPANTPAAQRPAAGNCAASEPAKQPWHDCHCGPQNEVWFDASYLVYWVKQARIPAPLVTTGPVAGGGIPGTPGTVVLFGGNDYDYGTFSGLSLNGGMWLDCRHTFGVELNGFFLGRQSVGATFASDATGTPFLARPVLNGLTLTPTPVFVSVPGLLTGSIDVRTTSQFSGAGFNFVKNISHSDTLTIDSLAGFRYLDLSEGLTVNQVSTPLGGGTLAFNGGALPPGVGVALADNFHTRNQFYGGVLGGRGEWRFGSMFVDVLSTVALGPNHEVLEINGLSRSLAGGPVAPGGLLAVGGGNEAVLGTNNGVPAVIAYRHQGNIGRFTTNRIVYAPEVGITAGAYVTSHVKLGIGYNFLYMSDVMRPGTQIDPVINPRFVPTSPAFGSVSGGSFPTLTGRHEDFHAQGIQFTVEVQY
jgi:hypothetical protein